MGWVMLIAIVVVAVVVLMFTPDNWLPAARVGDPAQIVCPHCQTRGSVAARDTKRSTRLGVRKTGAAILTLGASAPLTGGISKKQMVTEMSCKNCGMRWVVNP